MVRTRNQQAREAKSVVGDASAGTTTTSARPSRTATLYHDTEPKTTRTRSQSLRPVNPARVEKSKRRGRPASRDALRKLSIIPDCDKDDDDYEPGSSRIKTELPDTARRSQRKAAQRATVTLTEQFKESRKIFGGRVTKTGTKPPAEKSAVTRWTIKQTKVTETTTIISIVRKTTTVTAIATRRPKQQHLKVVLTGVDFDKLPLYIQQQDWKVLKQEKRLANYKGRYLPPPLRHYNNSYHFMFGHNPFKHTGFRGPSDKQLWDVYELMKKDLKDNFNKDCFLDQPDASTNELQDGPMHMTDDLSVDNLVKVILSISTENSLAIRQHAQLCSKFTYTVDGREVVGTIPNYHKMRVCSAEELIKALNIAGHHNIRQKAFHGILEEVFNQNEARAQPNQQFLGENQPGATDFVPGSLSMDYLKGEGLSKQERFDLLVKFPQIAVKTGCCLLAFNLKMPVFVVDTHVHHMVRNLEWIPENCYDADRACMFLDTLMPTELKFGLHQAFWHHRINCARCMPRANPKSPAYQERLCPLEHLIKRDLPSLRRNSSDDSSTDADRPAKPKKARTKSTTPKKLPGSIKFLNVHYKVAQDKGYALRKVDIDDDFGEGTRQNKSTTAHYFWGLKTHTSDDEVVDFQDALSASGLTQEQYDARFAKRSRAKKAKAGRKITAYLENGDAYDTLVDDDESLDDILDDLSDHEDDDFADLELDMSEAE